LLAALSDLWVISDLANPDRKLISADLDALGQARAGGPVRIGVSTGSTVAEAALCVAGCVTMHLRSHFGCRRLVEIVQSVFPLAPGADSFQLAILLMIHESLPPELAGPLLTWLEKKSEYIRFLNCHRAGEAAAAVRTEPLCKWLVPTFAGMDRWWLRAESKSEFQRAFGRGDYHDVKEAAAPSKTQKQTRNRRHKTAELLICMLQDDERLMDLSLTELATKLERDVSTISRAFRHKTWGPKLKELYAERRRRPPTVHDL
jgi:hypothetical protein